jgi:hypothetical protein
MAATTAGPSVADYGGVWALRSKSAINDREQTQQRASRARVRANSGPWEREMQEELKLLVAEGWASGVVPGEPGGSRQCVPEWRGRPRLVVASGIHAAFMSDV